MKQPRVIQRLSSLLLASLLLFTAVWGQRSLARQQTSVTKKAVLQHPKSDKAPASPAKDAQLNAAGFEAVVTPAVQIGDSGQTFFLRPAQTLVILLSLSVLLLRHFTLPHYYFSYFQHVFGHHIATNAP